MQKRFSAVLVFMMLISACGSLNSPATPTIAPTVAATATAIPPAPTPVPPTSPAALGTIALDFVALMCDAQWMNGYEHLTACPDPNTFPSGGWATLKDPISEGLPAKTPVLLMFAGNNSAALFLRYPTIKVHWTDRFRATLRCQINAPCDVQFALEYYDAQGKYHSPFYQWNYKTTDSTNSPAINADVDLSSLAGQSVDLVLALRPQNDFLAQIDGGLWIAPHIYRPYP